MADFLPVNMPPVHSDARGDLFEMLRFKDERIPGEGYIYCVTIEPGERRGDHYHTEKQEWFSCVSGEITVLAETPEGERQELVVDSKKPLVIRFDPYVSHAFINTGDTTAVAVFYGSVQHDQENPDSVRKVVGE